MANDTTVQDILFVYRCMLEITRDAFGKENMTEDVIRGAIREAGSMAWRMADTDEKN